MNLFTVLIAEKKHIDAIGEYKTFLKPFIDGSSVELCQWDTDAATLEKSVPHLREAVSRHRQWRAIVLCDEVGLEKKNPFDVVEFSAPKYTPMEEMEDDDTVFAHRQKYLEEVRKLKFEVFEKAAQQPLTRLMTFLCAGPTVGGGKSIAADLDPDYAEYLAESKRKQELREQIIAGEKLNFSLPAEVVCVAKRTYSENEKDIGLSWKPHQDIQYSRFYDWNMYFDKMRYLIYDILPKEHNDYGFDYIRFLYALLILANNEIPSGVLRPNRVFCMNCENNETALTSLLSAYDRKLADTGEVLSSRVRDIERTEKPRLSDRDAKTIFCSSINVPVTLSGDVGRDELFADPHALGLSTDCPKDEAGQWDNAYLSVRKSLQKILKQPRRALRKASDEARRLNYVDLDKADCLNEFQVEDVKEYTDAEELNMVAVDIPDIYDVEHYEKRMAEHDKKIKKKIDTRMPRKATVLLGLAVLVLYLIGFLPLALNNSADFTNVMWALIVAGAALLILAIVCWICLIFLRNGLRKEYMEFNRTMQDIRNEIDRSSAKFSNYLSHACNVMRGFGVLNHCEKHEEPGSALIRVYKKHILDIKRVRSEIREIFGEYVVEVPGAEADRPDIYPYDFTRAVDFPYPIPYNTKQQIQIEFMQPGVSVQVPVDFVKRITVRREELYD